MKQFVHILLVLALFCSFSFAQKDLDLSSFGSVKSLEKDFESFNDTWHAGMGALTWTEGAAPSIFGVGVGLYSGWVSFEKNSAIGLDKATPFFFNSAGLQVTAGTAGFEALVRFLPEYEIDKYKVSALGVGLKYELTDLIPVPAFPSTSLYVDYNSQSFVLDKTELDFSSIDIGGIIGYDLLVFSVYGKIGVELGNTSLKWQTPAGNVKGDIATTGLRYAAGLSLFGIRAELGGRNAAMAFGLGYGISF